MTAGTLGLPAVFAARMNGDDEPLDGDLIDPRHVPVGWFVLTEGEQPVWTRVTEPPQVVPGGTRIVADQYDVVLPSRMQVWVLDELSARLLLAAEAGAR